MTDYKGHRTVVKLWNALSGIRSYMLGRAFCAFLGLLTATSLFAQTEISGEVSGEWTAEDSPYIVVDSTWVPEDEELLIGPGVEVFFEEDQGLYVYGTVEAHGEEDDSVYIRVAEDVEHWRGLWFYGRNRTEWSYSSIVCPDYAFVLEPGYTLILDHTLLDATKPLHGNYRFGWLSRNYIGFSHSRLASRSHISLMGSRLTADHSLFDFRADEDDITGFQGDANIYRMTNCEMYGRLITNNGGYAIVDSCRFFKPSEDGRIGVSVRLGRMTDSYVEGSVSVGWMNSEQVVPFYRNQITGKLNVSGSADVEDCRIGGIMDIEFSVSVQIKRSIIFDGFWMSECQSVIVDSCIFISDNQEYRSISTRDVAWLEVSRCVLSLGIHLSGADQFLFDHNTIILDSLIHGISAPADSSWKNNIFLATYPQDRLFMDFRTPNIKYNCVWGIENVSGPLDDPIPIRDIDSTNIVANPIIYWDDMIPRLSLNSPCIDRGDPGSEYDPDSTRSDIGAFFYDQRLHITRPSEVEFIPTILSISAYPNPFNSTTTIVYSLPVASQISLQLYDLSGREIRTLVKGKEEAGVHTIILNAAELPSGLYFVRLEAAGQVQTRKVMLIR